MNTMPLVNLIAEKCYCPIHEERCPVLGITYKNLGNYWMFICNKCEKVLL